MIKIICDKQKEQEAVIWALLTSEECPIYNEDLCNDYDYCDECLRGNINWEVIGE